MSNATRFYCTVESVKRAVGGTIAGTLADDLIAAYIQAASEDIERAYNRRFIPLTGTKYYPWPQPNGLRSYVLYLDEDLIAVTSLTREGDTATAIDSGDYFLEPANLGPPYDHIEIDLSSSAYFASSNTHQRAVRVTGRWGYCEDTRAAGTLATALSDTTGTTVVCSDASLIGIGDTIKIDSEAMFVSAKATVDTTANTAGALIANKSETTVAVNTGSLVKAGEVILIDSEKMYVESVSGNNLSVVRAYDGSTLATHANPSDVYAYRTLTVTRGENGTTAATHSGSAAIVRYAPPVANICRSLAIAYHEQSRGGWTGAIGTAEAAVETRLSGLRWLLERGQNQFRRRAAGAV